MTLHSADQDENAVKAAFEDVYTRSTPHAYLKAMQESEYSISEAARPYFAAALELVAARGGPVQMLDIGCSYGIAAALLKFGCSFAELSTYFAGRAPAEFGACVESTRAWLRATRPPRPELRVVGLDVSGPALRFARETGMIDGAIQGDFEDDSVLPSDEDRGWLRGCNLMVSSGAIGYVRETTFAKLLPELGRQQAGSFGPLGVFSILRMFDTDSIRAAFEARGWRFEQVPGVSLPQRRFVDDAEREGILALLQERGLDPAGLESRGSLYANLFVSAPEAGFDELAATLRRTAAEQGAGPSA